MEQQLAEAESPLSDLFYALRETLLTLGDDVQLKTLKYYYAFKRMKNFACVEIRRQKRDVTCYVKVDPDSIVLEKGFTRDVRSIGDYGTGDLEISLRSMDDIIKATPLFEKSYEAS